MSKIYVSAGHGGKDSGAVFDVLLEKSFTLLVASQLAALLADAGHEVLRDRTSDKQTFINDKVRDANEAKVDLFIDIHLNAGGGTGCEVYHSVVGGTGKTLAEKICAEIAKLGYRNRGAKTKKDAQGQDYFGVIRMTTMPAVLVECCFIDSKDDMARFNTNQMAKAILGGILAICPAPVKPEPAPVKPTPPPVKPTPVPPKDKGWKIGDTVRFTGGKHYPSSSSSVAVGGQRKAGKAKITNIKLNARHPYHLIGIGACNVYGWVNKTQVQ